MSSKLPLSTFILIFALTILNCWWHLGQSIPDLTASPLFDQKRQIDELQNRSDENNHDLYSRGGGKKQDEVVKEKEKKEEKEEKEEKERGNVKEEGLLDWLLEQQERKATLAAACAKDPRWGKYIFRHLRHNKGSRPHPKRMKFRKSSKRPLTPHPPPFSESYVTSFFFQNS